MSMQSKPEIFTFEDTYLDQQQHQILSQPQESPANPQLSPLIKNAVRKSVLQRRKYRGEPELKVEFKQPVNYELTEEEKIKKVRRTTQNREAARRCRLKNKLRVRHDHQDVEYAMLNSINTALHNDVEGLAREVHELHAFLEHHHSSGLCVFHTCSFQPPEVAARNVQMPLQPLSVNVDNQSRDVTHRLHLHPPAHDTGSTAMAWHSDDPTPSSGLCDVTHRSRPFPTSYDTCPSPASPSSTTDDLLPMEETSLANVNDYFDDKPIEIRLPFTQHEQHDSGVRRPASGCWRKQNYDINRVTPDIPQDDGTSLYPRCDIKEAPTSHNDGLIGIPSLDCIDFEQLLPEITDFPIQYLTAEEPHL